MRSGSSTDHGIAGKVFQTGEALLVNDAYRHPDFNPEVDEQTGYETRNIACVPVRTVRGTVIGVAQVLNKSAGDFDRGRPPAARGDDDPGRPRADEQPGTSRRMEPWGAGDGVPRPRLRDHLRTRPRLAAPARDGRGDPHAQRRPFDAVPQRRLDAGAVRPGRQGDDDQDDGVDEIRFPNTVGIAGTIFTTGETINIPHAYADLRFNPSFDRQTGFFTRSILCVPLVNKAGETIGATQVLNKRGGPFTQEDEQRLKAFTAQVSIALENAKLFDDVQRVRNYNNAVLESMSNGVVTFDRDGCVATCNAAAAAILRRSATEMVGMRATDLFGADPLVVDLVESVIDDRDQVSLLDVDLHAGPPTTPRWCR